MPFGTDFYQAVVLPNIAEQRVPCKKTDISSLPRGEVKSIYVDTSVLLALLKRESCEHARHYENVAKAFDRLAEEKRTIFISEICMDQVYDSLVYKIPGGKNYFDLCMRDLGGYKRIKLRRKNVMADNLSKKLCIDGVGRLFHERIEDNIHAYIARAFGDVTIMTYDPAFLDIVNGRLEIEVCGEKWSLQYKRWEEIKPLNVISPEAYLGIDVPCSGRKVFNTEPQPLSCETLL